MAFFWQFKTLHDKFAKLITVSVHKLSRLVPIYFILPEVKMLTKVLKLDQSSWFPAILCIFEII